jgi:hypothetical protein
VKRRGNFQGPAGGTRRLLPERQNARVEDRRARDLRGQLEKVGASRKVFASGRKKVGSVRKAFVASRKRFGVVRKDYTRSW